MKVKTKDFIRPCACQSAGECTHSTLAWKEALDKLVDDFAAEMKTKLTKKAVSDGRSGWDDPQWSEADILRAMRFHMEKGDAVDVANYAAFLWNRQ